MTCYRCESGVYERLLRERDEARAVARILAHAYNYDVRPPAKIVARALEWPVSDAAAAEAHSK